MTPIITLIVSFSIAVLLGVAVYYLRKNYIASCDAWIFYDNLRGEAEDMNKKLTELNAFMKLTFNKKFAERVEDIIKIKNGTPATTEIIGMDGKPYVVPVDQGY